MDVESAPLVVDVACSANAYRSMFVLCFSRCSRRLHDLYSGDKVWRNPRKRMVRLKVVSDPL